MADSPFSKSSAGSEDYHSALEFAPSNDIDIDIDNGNGNGNIDDNDNDNDNEMGDSADEPADLLASLDRLNDASIAAIAIERRYSKVDPPPDAEEDLPKHASNIWKNVPALQTELEESRRKLEEAWRWSRAWLEQEQKERGIAVAEDEDSDENDDDTSVDLGASVPIDFKVTVDLNMEATIEGVDDNYGNGDGDHDGEEKWDGNNSTTSSGSNIIDDKEDDDAIPEDEFRALYMEMMTETFGEALDQVNQEGANANANAKTASSGGGGVDVDILVEALQSGIDLLDPHEKNTKSFFASLGSNRKIDSDATANADPAGASAMDTDDGNRNDNDNPDDDDEELPVHERRRRELGYRVFPKEGGIDIEAP